jgi:hypothetical protein
LTFNLASGENFPDALAAGGLAVKRDAPLLLVPTADLSELAAFISNHRTRFDSAIVMGGSAAVTHTVFDQINRVINGQPEDLAPPPPPPPRDPGCVDLDTASFEDLQQVIHIGPDRAHPGPRSIR